MTKAKLYKILLQNGVTEKESRAIVIDVVSKVRDMDRNSARWIRSLYPKEVVIIKDFFGVE